MDLEDKFYIRGKGRVITARLEAGEPLPEIGSEVEYQGVRYRICRVECFTKPLSIPILSNNIGLIGTEVL